MPHVSSKILTKDIEERISNELFKSLVQTKKAGGKDLFRELLTPTEQVMLAKRLAIIYMLANGYSHYRIIGTLDVSGSTVRRLSAQFEAGLFNSTKFMIRRQKEQEQIWDAIMLAARGGLPPMGVRWKRNQKMP